MPLELVANHKFADKAKKNIGKQWIEECKENSFGRRKGRGSQQTKRTSLIYSIIGHNKERIVKKLKS